MAQPSIHDRQTASPSPILPVVDLALLVVLVFVPITMTALHLYQASKGSDPVHIHSGQVEMTLPAESDRAAGLSARRPSTAPEP